MFLLLENQMVNILLKGNRDVFSTLLNIEDKLFLLNTEDKLFHRKKLKFSTKDFFSMCD